MRPFSNNEEIFNSIIAIARFTTSRQAKSCQLTLTTLFNTIAQKVDALFEQGNGQAELSALAAIYEQYGFRNENGWEQEHPIMVSDNEVAWPLSFGVRKRDVEDLLQAMEPQSIEFHDMHEPSEDWQMYPVPEMIGFIDDTDDLDFDTYFEDEEYLGNPPKRIIH
ncbi:MAG: hypothetical protein JXX29_02160 [Deltaproteobacteria bacterium]|nr:hypothetical protein [Deltaproteobacteria bacterium]MBN2670446.1 hypothetical protein [Deltaproteobacteria bacterium]